MQTSTVTVESLSTSKAQQARTSETSEASARPAMRLNRAHIHIKEQRTNCVLEDLALWTVMRLGKNCNLNSSLIHFEAIAL